VFAARVFPALSDLVSAVVMLDGVKGGVDQQPAARSAQEYREEEQENGSTHMARYAIRVRFPINKFSPWRGALSIRYDDLVAEQHHHPKLTESGILRGPVRVEERRRLLGVLLLTGVTMIAEFVGGLLTHSLALLGDAFHMLTHFGSIGLSLLAVTIAMRPAPPDKTYRYWRAEVIASLVNGLALIPIAIFILVEAVHRWQRPVSIDAIPMLGVAAIGLAVNLVSAAMLHRHHEHDLNMRGAFVHMMADAASSIGVLVAGVLVYFFRWSWSDPLIAGLISVLVLVWSVGLIRGSIRILLESVPHHMNLEEVRARIKAETGVAEVHDLHVWTITSGMYALTAHVILSEDLPVSRTEEVSHRIQHALDREFDIQHATLQFETNHAETRCDHEHRPAGSETRS